MLHFDHSHETICLFASFYSALSCLTINGCFASLSNVRYGCVCVLMWCQKRIKISKYACQKLRFFLFHLTSLDVNVIWIIWNRFCDGFIFISTDTKTKTIFRCMRKSFRLLQLIIVSTLLMKGKIPSPKKNHAKQTIWVGNFTEFLWWSSRKIEWMRKRKRKRQQDANAGCEIYFLAKKMSCWLSYNRIFLWNAIYGDDIFAMQRQEMKKKTEIRLLFATSTRRYKICTISELLQHDATYHIWHRNKLQPHKNYSMHMEESQSVQNGKDTHTHTHRNVCKSDWKDSEIPGAPKKICICKINGCGFFVWCAQGKLK